MDQPQVNITAELEELKEASKTVEDEAWRLAEKFFKHLGPPHGLFSRAIRSMRRDNAVEIAVNARAEYYKKNLDFVHLWRSPQIRAIVYFAAQRIFPEKFKAMEGVTAPKLLTLFSPPELAAVITSAYLYRHCKRILGKDLWKLLAPEAEMQIEAGASVGVNIPAIGIDVGLMAMTARFFGFSLFATLDEKGFKVLRRELNRKELLYSTTSEKKEWGCTHAHLGALILQTYGFGIGASTAMLSLLQKDAEINDLGQQAQRWRAAILWTEAVLIGEEVPKQVVEIARFAPSEDGLKVLNAQVEEINRSGASFDWLHKSPDKLDQETQNCIRSINGKYETAKDQKPGEIEPPADFDPDRDPSSDPQD